VKSFLRKALGNFDRSNDVRRLDKSLRGEGGGRRLDVHLLDQVWENKWMQNRKVTIGENNRIFLGNCQRYHCSGKFGAGKIQKMQEDRKQRKSKHSIKKQRINVPQIWKLSGDTDDQKREKKTPNRKSESKKQL